MVGKSKKWRVAPSADRDDKSQLRLPPRLNLRPIPRPPEFTDSLPEPPIVLHPRRENQPVVASPAVQESHSPPLQFRKRRVSVRNLKLLSFGGYIGSY